MKDAVDDDDDDARAVDWLLTDVGRLLGRSKSDVEWAVPSEDFTEVHQRMTSVVSLSSVAAADDDDFKWTDVKLCQLACVHWHQ